MWSWFVDDWSSWPSYAWEQIIRCFFDLATSQCDGRARCEFSALLLHAMALFMPQRGFHRADSYGHLSQVLRFREHSYRALIEKEASICLCLPWGIVERQEKHVR